jgi:hypothetical protein
LGRRRNEEGREEIQQHSQISEVPGNRHENMVVRTECYNDGGSLEDVISVRGGTGKRKWC